MLGQHAIARHAGGGGGGRRSLGAKILAFTAAASLALVGVVGLVVAPSAMAEGIGTGDGDVTFCHASSSSNNPYGDPQTTSFESFKRGHANHTGPVYPAPGWGDIYPPNNYQPAGQNWDAAGQAIFYNGCRVATPNAVVVPVGPAVTQAQCTTAGVASAPTMVLASTEGIAYSQSAPAAQGATVTVTAAPQLGFSLSPAPGWIPQENGTATFTATFDTVNCIVTATPVAPTVAQSVCTGPGTATTPTVTPAETAGISYSVSGTVAQGSTVTVTATPQTGYALAPAAGWVPGPNGSASYTFTVTLNTLDCTVAATPVNPAVVQAVCTGPGTATTPTVTPAETAGISYSVSGTVAQGSTVTVTATPQTGYALAPAAGWVPGPNGSASYTFTVTLNTLDCTVAATPVNPAVVQAVCTGPGTATTPTVTPAETAGISYSVSGTVAQGSTVTVTATPQTGYALAPAAGWVPGPNGSATYTFTVTLDTLDCTVMATPVNPAVVQSVCTGPGTATTPTLTFATTDGVSYSQDVPATAGATVTVTATANSGFKLQAADGWMLKEDGTATFTVEFGTLDCTVVATPAVPTATQAVCTGPGMATTPGADVPADTESISYSMQGTAAQGSTVYVIATPAQGYALKAGSGWSLNEDGTASFRIEFDTVNCLVDATPETPTFAQQVCTGPGATDGPSMSVPANSDGISYSVAGAATPGGTVTITATPREGYRLVLPANGFAPLANKGWVLNEGGTAAYSFTFDPAPDCTVAATPAAPVAVQAQCTGPGTASSPTLTFASTAGVSYTQNKDAAAGTKVTVTASPKFGHKLAAAEGWTPKHDGTATFTVKFSTPDCMVKASPAVPTAAQAVCSNGTLTAPTLSLASTTGISYKASRSAENGKSVTVRATPANGYELAKTANWAPHKDGSATFKVKFTHVKCPVVSAAGAGRGATLANTGFGPGWSIPLAGLFLLLGAGAVWRSRRPLDH
ncbi:InlB B-repeat-containing protein [Arthrobacter sp. HY1533]|uniref:InlB B-repeat-containing protein n=1 Tax=Arthrobacter sp. HY1533 TaxID=2970919 RepID=UPI0022B9D93B|nr:hypothetical protein [Arthrobacter sp. HY1533]